LYLQISQAAVHIHEFVPRAKLLAVLLNPIDRTYSHFLMHSRNGLAPGKNFLQTIALEDLQDENFQPDISTRYNTGATVTQNPLMCLIINTTPHSLRPKLKYALPPPVFRWYLSRRFGNHRQENININAMPIGCTRNAPPDFSRSYLASAKYDRA